MKCFQISKKKLLGAWKLVEFWKCKTYKQIEKTRSVWMFVSTLSSTFCERLASLNRFLSKQVHRVTSKLQVKQFCILWKNHSCCSIPSDLMQRIFPHSNMIQNFLVQNILPGCVARNSRFLVWYIPMPASNLRYSNYTNVRNVKFK